jgi:hypothetical protein
MVSLSEYGMTHPPRSNPPCGPRPARRAPASLRRRRRLWWSSASWSRSPLVGSVVRANGAVPNLIGRSTVRPLPVLTQNVSQLRGRLGAVLGRSTAGECSRQEAATPSASVRGRRGVAGRSRFGRIGPAPTETSIGHHSRHHFGVGPGIDEGSLGVTCRVLEGTTGFEPATPPWQGGQWVQAGTPETPIYQGFCPLLSVHD